jgi:prevent-host-death family protein
MISEIGIAELKAHLSETLRKVEDGDSVVVLDRRRPIARLVPIENETLRVTAPTRSHKTFKYGQALKNVDPVEALLLERRERT